ncbi:unnamed protein product, partial [Mesorhabditis belari]|uniref:Sphingomyelin phosphodiesterase n=1 Tax=Mesorhabditis belari TaxID=2138241 RepID=A0AAF3EP09_9BILA
MKSLLFVFFFSSLAIAGLIVHDSRIPKDAKFSRHYLGKTLWSFVKSPDPEVRSASCGLCTLVVDAIQSMIKNNNTDEEIFQVIENICINLNIEQPYVCKGMVEIFGPEIVFVLQRAVFTPEEVCGAFIDDCGHSDNPLQELWNMTIPGNKPAVKPWPRPQNGKPTMRVLHLSDIHIDRWYEVGSEADCTDGKGLDAFGTYALCCRNYPPAAGDREKKAIKTPAGPWGSPMKCDIPFQTYVSAMKHINQTEKLDYIIVTGDFEAHDIWDYTQDRTKANIENITAVLREFFPHTPIYQAIGNHEGVPSDAMPAHTMDGYDTHSPQWLYDALADAWAPDITPQAVNDVRYRASYATYIKQNLKLISINSVYCSTFNFFNYLNQVDPDGTLQWLVEQLLDSEAKGEKVHIISHVPSGVTYCLKGWSTNYYEIVNRFENTITAQFYGHTHYDHFEVFYENADPTKRATHFNFIAPSLTTYDFLNPSYRIYTIDGAYSGSTYTVLESDTYWGDVNQANQANQEPNWQLLYNAKKEYQMLDLSPESWSALAKRFDTDFELFKKFHTNYYRNANYKKMCPFEDECRGGFTCAMRSARSFDEKHFCPSSKK